MMPTVEVVLVGVEIFGCWRLWAMDPLILMVDLVVTEALGWVVSLPQLDALSP